MVGLVGLAGLVIPVRLVGLELVRGEELTR